MSFECPRNIKFRCTRCGLCCGDTKEKTRHILLLQAEADEISSAMNQPILEFATKLEGKQPYVYEMKKTADRGMCLFLNKDSSCRIYSKRPLICRFYPFGLDSTPNCRLFYFTNECPGIGKGRRILKRDFQRLLGLADRRASEIHEIST